MAIDEILGLIFGGVSLLILVCGLVFVLVYFAKEEKEHKILLSKELKVRIELYKDIKDYLNK